MMEKWKISLIVKNLARSPKIQADLHAKIKEEMKKEMERSKDSKENKYSKFVRSSTMSKKIGENYQMMDSLLKATKNCK